MHAIQTGTFLDSSSPFVLESVHDPPFEPNQSAATEIISTDLPSSSTQIIPQPLTTKRKIWKILK